jgi:hypothetical protein
MALFCGVAVISIEHLLNRVTSTKTARILATTVFVVAVAAYVRNDSYFLFSMPGRELSRAQYGANPFVEAPELARYVRAHTDSRDRIAVLGSEPEIYFYANRKSATGYIYTYGLMEQQKYSHKMQDEMITEITAAHPKYVLFVAISTSWNAQSPTEKIITWSEAYLSKCYVRIGIAEIKPDNTTRWFWDADLPKYQPESPFALYLFKAKTDEPCAVPN